MDVDVGYKTAAEIRSEPSRSLKLSDPNDPNDPNEPSGPPGEERSSKC